jgi:hypothetical protein
MTFSLKMQSSVSAALRPFVTDDRGRSSVHRFKGVALARNGAAGKRGVQVQPDGIKTVPEVQPILSSEG